MNIHRSRERPQARAPLLSTPFFAFGRKPFREAHLAGYIVRQHRRGRTLAEILADPYVARFGEDRRRILVNPQLIEALKEDTLAAIEREFGPPALPAEPSGPSILRMIEALHRY
jgi:hypothetical protein